MSGASRIRRLKPDWQVRGFDAVVLSIGVVPETRIAGEAGIELGTANAIKINEYLETNISDIYAAGDCATTTITGFGLESHTPLALKANRQGMIAGANIAGSKEPCPGVLNSAVTKVFDLGVARTGLSFGEAEQLGLEPVKKIITSRDKAHYYPGSKKLMVLLIISKKSRRVLGAQITGGLNAVKRIDTLTTAITAGFTIDQVFDLDIAYAPPFSPVYDPVIMAARVAKKKL